MQERLTRCQLQARPATESAPLLTVEEVRVCARAQDRLQADVNKLLAGMAQLLQQVSTPMAPQAVHKPDDGEAGEQLHAA